MLRLKREHLNEIINHVKYEFPIEACGVCSCDTNKEISEKVYSMKNICKSENYFKFDSKEQLQVWKDIAKNNKAPLFIYHSHTNSEAFPSKEDIKFAGMDDLHYLIISIIKGQVSEIRSFRIINKNVIEERVLVTH